MNSSLLRSVLASSFIALAAQAAPQSFDFKDPKGVNNIQFKLDAPLESISGTVSFAPAAPAATTGTITLETKSLTVGNPLQAEHLHSANWLDVAQYPTITFEAVKFSSLRTQGSQTLADVTGNLTIKGITKEITAPITLTYLADKLGARLGDDTIKGDLLVLRATFEINRNDFNIMPGKLTDKVSETIQLSLALAGAAPRK